MKRFEMLAAFAASVVIAFSGGQLWASSRANASEPRSDFGSAIADLEACDDPVYLVVWIDHLDRTKSAPYGAGLRQTRIVPRHGGEYLAVSPPLKVLEGDWPADRAVVVERYPCQAAIERMWYSDEYQNELKPLRAGSGTYDVAVFKAFRPAPASANN